MKTRKENAPLFVYEYDYTADLNTGNFDPLVNFFQSGASMVLNARAFRRKKGVSHRKVFVGAALMANNFEERKQRMYVGWNYSPFEGSGKRCAEMRAIWNAIGKGYTKRDAVVVAGENNPEVIRTITGIPSRILPPCEPCRDLLEDSTVVMAIGGVENIYAPFIGKALRSGEHLAPLDRPQRDDSIEMPPVYDLETFRWAKAEEEYRDKTSGITGISFSDGGILLARANIAVQVLGNIEHLL
jgi:cytidine deaminase